MGVNLCDPVVIKCSRLYNCFHMTNLWVYFQKEINLNHTPKSGVISLLHKQVGMILYDLINVIFTYFISLIL